MRDSFERLAASFQPTIYLVGLVLLIMRGCCVGTRELLRMYSIFRILQILRREGKGQVPEYLAALRTGGVAQNKDLDCRAARARPAAEIS